MANNLVAFDATKFSKKIVEKLQNTHYMLGLVNRDYEGDLTENSTVKVRTLGNITLQPYTKYSTLAVQDIAPAMESFTVADAQAFAFAIDEIDLRQNDINALDAYATEAARSMSNAVESKILSMYQYAHVDNRINVAGALDQTNVYATIVKARGCMSKKNVPVDGRWLIADPDTVGALLEAPGFVRNLNDDSTTANGKIGRIAGFDVYESNAVPVVGGNKFLVYGDNLAIAYAGQITKIAFEELPLTFEQICKGLLLHDAHVFAESSKRLGFIEATA